MLSNINLRPYISATMNHTASTGGSAATVSLTAASSTQLTTDGSSIFYPVLSAVPLVGIYEISFSGADCTNGRACQIMPIMSSSTS